jgi:hypothetical protein
MRSRVACLISGLWFKALDAVDVDTPASFAKSVKVRFLDVFTQRSFS